LWAGRLAKCGGAVPHRLVADPGGFTRRVAQGPFDPTALKALGRRWHLLDPGIDTKAYPVCLSSHAAADAVRDLMTEHRLPPSDITAVRCVVPPLVAANLTYDRPATPGEARFSLPFAVACVMLHGDLTLDHLTTATLADPHLHAAMERVSMRPDPGWNADPDRARLAPEGADVTVETATGRTFRRFCASARGTVARPLSAQEHAGKFHDCAGRAMGPEAAARLHRKLLDIDALPRLDGLLDGSIG
ncbi:MmgE/PrpD family protein, partial [Azospirillum brasilense]|nr:MmgE/PrpD family protein [Azospirillum brasilense]